MMSLNKVLLGIIAAVTFLGVFIAWLTHQFQTWKTAVATFVAMIIGFTILLTTRHIQIAQNRHLKKWPTPMLRAEDAKTSELTPEYYLFVLGSGGHTKEMLMMMDDGTHDFGNTHRRYLISSGDGMSENHLEDYEAGLKKSSLMPGTYDKCTVTRARRVHQPLWSTPWTGLLSIIDIFPALLSPPKTKTENALEYPGVIFSNGPATGFFVALAVHVLKLLGAVPDDKMKFVYIESWARITTLSLTGKLLYYTGIADAFYVQHEEVAAKYGLVNAGEMVFNARRLD